MRRPLSQAHAVTGSEMAPAAPPPQARESVPRLSSPRRDCPRRAIGPCHAGVLAEAEHLELVAVSNLKPDAHRAIAKPRRPLCRVPAVTSALTTPTAAHDHFNIPSPALCVWMPRSRRLSVTTTTGMGLHVNAWPVQLASSPSTVLTARITVPLLDYVRLPHWPSCTQATHALA